MNTDELINALAADNAGAKGADRVRQRGEWIALALALAISIAVVMLALGLRSDLAGAGFDATLQKALAALATACAGIALALRLSRPDGVAAAFWIAPVLVLAGLVARELAMLGSAGWSTRLMGTSISYCLVLVPLVSLPLLGVGLMMLKRRAPSQPLAAGAAAGLAAGGIGAGIYALHCTEDSMLFVAVWYSIAVLICVAGGALAGRRLLIW